MTDSLDLKQLTDSCISIAREAGKKILEVYNSDFAVEHKDDKSPLTDADMASHHTIIDGLTALTPDIPVLSEESAKLPFEERQQWDTYWLVDPLDGTREFVKRNGEFTVNIALIQNHKSIIGVIHVPVLDIDYFACKGVGAFKSEQGGAPQPISVKTPEDNRLVVAGMRFLDNILPPEEHCGQNQCQTREDRSPADGFGANDIRVHIDHSPHCQHKPAKRAYSRPGTGINQMIVMVHCVMITSHVVVPS